MSVTVTGKVLKLEANKYGFYGVSMKDENDQWFNIGLGIKQPPKTFKKGDTIEISYDPDNYNNVVGVPKVVAEASSAPQGGSGGYNKGGYNKGSKKPFVDNSVGMGIGAALNNAIQLFIGGKVKEAEIPVVMANLYELSEAMKQAATADTLQAVASEYSFSLTGAVQDEPTPKAPAKKPAAKKAEQPEPEPTYDGGEDFDDSDIPF